MLSTFHAFWQSMDASPMLLFLPGICLVALSIKWFASLKPLPQTNLPPGPPAFPIIGHIHLIPASNPWRKFQKWHKRYGPIFTLRFGQRTVIAVGSHGAAHDLLNKRNEIYSSRPRFVVGGERMSRGFRSVYLPYGEQWKKHNRIHSAFLSPQLAPKYRTLQDLESKQLVFDLLSTNDFAACFHRYSTSLIHTVAYGSRLSQGELYEVQEIKALAENVSHVLHSDLSMLVEAFPGLNKLPKYLAPWKIIGDRSYQRAANFVRRNLTQALKTKSWNWAKECMRLEVSKDLTFVEIAHIVGILFEAGSDSTPKVLEVFVMACLFYPNAVLEAQRELDEVIGSDRLPQFSDMARLPYITAFVNETLRWRPITPAGVPHANLVEDTFMGYRIPKGATIVATHWSLDLDEETFPNAFEFKPERWLTGSQLPLSAFGFGRRACPAQNLARNSLNITMARILWGFTISNARENGKEVKVDPWSMTQGSLSGPTPFKATFAVRSEEHRQTIVSEWGAAEKDADLIVEKVLSEIAVKDAA